MVDMGVFLVPARSVNVQGKQLELLEFLTEKLAAIERLSRPAITRLRAAPAHLPAT